MNYQLQPLPLDPIFVRLNRFRADSHPKKINLGIGIYADEMGTSYVPPSIQQAAKRIDTSNFDYVSMQGDTYFLRQVKKFILGEDFFSVAMQQSAGGTHAVRLAGDLLRSQNINQFVWGTPSWGNYMNIMEVKNHIDFPHLNENGDINFLAYKKHLETVKNPKQTLLLLQGSQTHNQTGKNLTLDQLKELAVIIKEREIWTLIDAAYIGFGDGFEEDLVPVRYLFDVLDKVLLAVSFSKNASLYRQRLGTLLVKAKNETEKNLIETNLQVNIRATISNPPAFGSTIMSDVFKNNLLGWKNDVDAMRESVNKRRESLIDGLSGKLDYLSDCRGMFGTIQANKDQIEFLASHYGVYILPSGRINFSGIPVKDMKYLVESLAAVL